MSKSPGFDDLKSLYTIALKVRDRHPWNYMEESQMWAVGFPDPGETLYAMVIGAMGESYGLVFYRGDRGLRVWRKITANEMDAREVVQHMDSLAMNFDPWRELPAPEKKRLKRLGYQEGPSLWPSFVSYLPGRYSADPNAEEVGVLDAALRVSLTVLDAVKKDPKFLRGKTESWVLHFDASHPKSPGEWKTLPEDREYAKAAPDLPLEPVAAPLDELAVRRLALEPLAPCAPWEVLIANSGIPVRDGKKGATVPLLAIVVDSTTGFVAGFTVAPADEIQNRLPEKILASMKEHRAKPAAFHVESLESEIWMAPLARALSIPIERKERLREAREALNAARGYLKKNHDSR